MHAFPPAIRSAVLLVIMLAGCAAPPDATITEDLTARPVSLEIKDAEGSLSPREREELLQTAAGDAASAEYLQRLAEIEQAVTGQALIAGNRVQLLVDGPAAYKAMFAAIAKAQNHIHLETYILADDEIGQQLASLLLERRAAGVEVAIIFDDLGSNSTSDAYFERLQNAGIKLFRFHPINPVEDIRIWRINQRNHRKILIIDGRIAFTGGMNISSVYASSSFTAPRKAQETDDRWRDTQVRIEGPVVAEFQKLFLATWAESDQKTALDRHDNFPPLDEAGAELVRVVPNIGGPDISDNNNNQYDIYATYLAAIKQAQQRLWITQAYFTPDQTLLEALQQAARRGVDVRILLPGFTDAALVIHASRANYTALLEAGVKLYEREDALLHAKTAVIDGVWSTVGSSNFDYRSFLHNNEANAVILGQAFGQQMEALFLQDLQHSRRIRLREWEQRPLWLRAKERFSSLFDYWL